jgi:gliding motility-associated-like protein
VNNVFSDRNNNIHLPTQFGDVIDHAPLTFYSNNTGSVIPSSFIRNGNTISFSLGNYDKTKTAVIDPWSQTPTIAASNAVQECERDGAGNVYIIGGETPMKLLKYNSAGTIQWTYTTTYDTIGGDWLGTFATDLAGNSYVTCGSSAALTKVNTSAGLVYNVNGGAMDEYWNIAFNCDQTKLIIGGTRLTGIPIITGSGVIFDINTANGSVNSMKTVAYTTPGFGPIANPNEVRSITSSRNGRYYYLTLDSMGCIDQNFSACSSSGGGPIFKISSGYKFGYKCENYRPNNGNGGIMSIRANKNFVYTSNGTNIQKRSLANGAVLATAAIPAGINNSSLGFNSIGNSGIDIDTCGNVYVGTDKAVIKYDANLNQLASFTLPFTVYDVTVSTNGDVIAAGAVQNNSSVSRTGYVQSISAFAACKPLTLQCCDATPCNAGPFCDTDPPQTLSSSTPGGTWSGTGITNPTTGVFSPAVSGTGTFTITYNISCGKDSMQIIVKTCATPTVCLQPNGDLTASGGAGNYHWDVQGTANDCSACILVALCQPPAPNCPQVITTWTTYSTSTTATPPGTFPIRVVDGSGNMLVINSLAGIQPCSNLTTAQSNISCFGQCTGTATVTATSGTPPYTYSWNTTPVQTTQVATGLCAGTYSATVTDASPATSNAVVTITQPSAAVAATATVTSSSCGSGGSATVNASGGTPTYTYAWAPSGGTAASASGLAAGNYTITVTDSKGCSAVATVSVTTASGGTVSVTAQTIQCNGDSATVNATMSGGTSPYTYAWTSGQTTSSVNVPAGNYSVTVTDASGCTSTQTVSLTQPTALTSSISVTGTNCGTNTGSASVSAAGGTGTLTYLWSPGGQATPGISNLGAGTYSCTVTDANGCTKIVSGVVSNLNGPTANITSQTNNTCFGGTNGTAAAAAAGGTSPYTFIWNTTPPQTTSNATGLAAGTYTVIVTDATGCTNTQTVLITAPAALSASVTTTQASCGNSDGTASAAAAGGSGSYTYSWSNGQSTQQATGLAAGIYSVTITDANGCSQVFSATVTNSNGPTALAGSTATIVQGNTIQLTASGGVSYSWSPATGLSNATIANPNATPSVTTTYCVFVTDASGCSDSACVTITVEAPCVNTYYIPNAFSPNNDAENDFLQVFFQDVACVKEYKLAVYDRWGEKVFETTDPAMKWDGIYNNKIMGGQVLAYYLHLLFKDGTVVDKQGNISLVK